MLFNSLSYGVFLVVWWSVFWLAPARWRVDVLLVASYVFYASWSKKYAALMFLLTVMNYFFGLAVARAGRWRLLLLWLFLGVDLGALGIFKYWNFAAESLWAGLASAVGIRWRAPLLDLILPLGISFFTFEFIHYLVDIYHGHVPVHSFRKFHVFAAFFPTQIAGPIKRFQQFVPNLDRIAAFDWSLAVDGLRLIGVGLVKKVLLADTLAPIAGAAFAAVGSRPLGTLEAWVGVLAFSFQIYLDFSAYTDIARGSAQLFGFQILINFNSPYLARSVSDFWRRWHISLSTWLRDYLFIPLGGSRRTLAVTARNLLITMILGGLWHGAAWHFVAWGAFWGAVLVIDRARQAFVPLGGGRARTIIGWLTTQLIVLVGWVLFRAASVADAGVMLLAMFTYHPTVELAALRAALATVAVAVISAGAVAVLLGLVKPPSSWWLRLPVPIQPVAAGVAMAIALAVTFAVAPATAQKFIYFQF